MKISCPMVCVIPVRGTGYDSARRLKRPDMPTFRDRMVEIAKHRNDGLGNRVLWNISEETDLPARDARTTSVAVTHSRLPGLLTYLLALL